MTLVCSVAGRALAVVALLMFVGSKEDLLIATIIQSSATVLSGLVSLYVIRKLHLSLFRPGFKHIWKEVLSACKDVKMLAPSEYLNSAISQGGVFILSLFASDVVVGVFAAVEKLARAAYNMFLPIIKALFPKVSGLWLSGNISDYGRVIRTWTLRILLLAVGAAAFLYFGAPLILEQLFGVGWSQNAMLLKAFSFWLFAIVASTTVGQLCILASGRQAEYSRVLLMAGLLQCALLVKGAYEHGAFGVVIALLGSETVKLLLFLNLLKRDRSEVANANS